MNRLNVCDLNAIETRVGAWLAKCYPLMDVFKSRPGKPNGNDPYLDFAMKMTGIPYEKLEVDIKSKDPVVKALAKEHRQTAKPGVLGAIYRLSGGQWGKNKYGDKIKTGLWGYAANMGVEMTQQQAHTVVRMFREAYPEIPACWKMLEVSVSDVMKGINTIRYIGPDNCVKIDKINIEGRYPLMRMQLPSGRHLHYLDARLEICQMPWEDKDTGEKAQREALVYAGVDQDTKQWDVWTQTHGGKLFENLVQGIARDILAVKLLEFEENDMPVVIHVHDEGVCLVPDDPFSPGVKDMVKIMSRPVEWAPGLLLGADGFEDSFYHK